MTDMVIDSIGAAADADRPFFALIGYPAPHARAGLPLADIRPGRLFQQIARRYPNIFLANPVPAPRHVGLFADEVIPDTPAFNEPDVSDKPEFNRQIAKGPAQIERARQFYVKVLESLLSVDESVARVVGEVDDRGLLDETWFVFTSDNGIVLGEHRIFGAKYLPYEPGIRVPLVIRGPGVEGGSTSSSLVSNVDLAPTIVELAGAEPPRSFDGRSLVGLLTGTEDPWARAVLLEGFEFRAVSPPYAGVHTGDSAYWEWATGERELYDLVADPHQLDNLAGRPEAAALETRNAALLAELQACEGPPCATVGAALPLPGDPAR
jgi:arylsulfatase A-like enzyme